MRSLNDIAHFIAAQPLWVDALRHVERLGLRDRWIGAGFIRNAIWDALHGRMPDLADHADIDVIFFDPSDLSREREAALEQALREASPGLPWSVRNQARMHMRNGDAPYRDSADAMRYWPETATAIGARLHDGQIDLIAPYDVEDLVDLIVRPTPPFLDKLDIYRERIRSKNWKGRWPRLTIMNGVAEGAPVTPDQTSFISTET
ncbi:nucleotidyltransferase family protein [Microvirga sp. 2MCAF38]|uniref:nucleotidyltransferase family protein n=1 Tax=Microvirga sp. 2MCAF38 TaxID=3232989 RepID=UPI003F99404D